jgi:hypothetical protein
MRVSLIVGVLRFPRIPRRGFPKDLRAWEWEDSIALPDVTWDGEFDANDAADEKPEKSKSVNKIG